MRDSVFVSYSHKDGDVLNDLRIALAAMPEHVHATIWDDTRITPSTQWRSEIQEAISTAAAAVLLLSPAFFASSFIAEYELPALLAAAERGEIRVFPVVLVPGGHERVTTTFQAVNDPGSPLSTLEPDARQAVWERLVSGLGEVAEQISDESRIGAEIQRLRNDLSTVPAIAAVNEKIEQAKSDPAFDENESMRENTLVFLEGQRCQATSTWLIEQSKRLDLSIFRSKAIVRLMQETAAAEEKALERATQITQRFADQTLEMLKQAKERPGSQL